MSSLSNLKDVPSLGKRNPGGFNATDFQFDSAHDADDNFDTPNDGFGDNFNSNTGSRAGGGFGSGRGSKGKASTFGTYDFPDASTAGGEKASSFGGGGGSKPSFGRAKTAGDLGGGLSSTFDDEKRRKELALLGVDLDAAPAGGAKKGFNRGEGRDYHHNLNYGYLVAINNILSHAIGANSNSSSCSQIEIIYWTQAIAYRLSQLSLIQSL
jgi:hypothetical protein